MTDKVQIGIIGTSWWTDVMFLSSFKSHPFAEITSICGRDGERAQELAAKYQIPHAFTDYRELLDKSKIDALVVATPDDLHYQITMDALDLDLHILCEKPMALNAQHAREMYDKAEARGVKHMVLFTWRWQPHFRYLKRLVDEGYIGQSFNADFYFLSNFAIDPVYRWRADGDRSNGVVSDLGAHMIDFARWYIGKIVKVNAQLATFVEIPGVDNMPLNPTNDSASVLLQFDNGAQGVIRVSSIVHRGEPGANLGVRLFGNMGTVEVDQIFSWSESGATFRGVRSNEERLADIGIPEEYYENIRRNELFDPYYHQSVGPRLFVDAILEDQHLEPNFFDGFQVQEAIDSILKSSRVGGWVEL